MYTQLFWCGVHVGVLVDCAWKFTSVCVCPCIKKIAHIFFAGVDVCACVCVSLPVLVCVCVCSVSVGRRSVSRREGALTHLPHSVGWISGPLDIRFLYPILVVGRHTCLGCLYAVRLFCVFVSLCACTFGCSYMSGDVFLSRACLS